MAGAVVCFESCINETREFVGAPSGLLCFGVDVGATGVEAGGAERTGTGAGACLMTDGGNLDTAFVLY